MTSPHPVLVLIFTELGLAACHPNEVGPEPEMPPAPVHAPLPTASIPARATSAPPASATPYTSLPGEGATCWKHKDCAAGLTCLSRTNGARILPGPGLCAGPGPHPGGRPLLVDGVARVAEATAHASWLGAASAEPRAASAAFVAALRADAFAEHASVPAFARTLCELLARGAPAWLVEKTAAALQDEIRHARDTFAWLTRLTGEAVGPGRLPEAVAPFDTTDPHALLRDVIRGGCIGETLAACTAHDRAAVAPSPELRAFYQGIAADEARHAALAYETARWLIELERNSAVVVHDERRSFHAYAAPADVARVAPLLELLHDVNPRHVPG